MLTERCPEAARIVLVGFMGSGKTTVGRRLADRLGRPVHDSDTVLEQRAGRTIGEIFAQDGEPAFRDLEHRVVADLLDGPAPFVLSLGGGAAMHPGTRRLLADRALVVHLRVGLATALERVGADPRRPMLARPDLPRLHADRAAAHDTVADVVVDVDGTGVETVADTLVALLDALPSRTTTPRTENA